jgi:hypothetical protein
MATLMVAATVYINTKNILAADVTPAKRADVVKVRRRGKAKDKTSATTATNKNVCSGCRDTAWIMA